MAKINIKIIPTEDPNIDEFVVTYTHDISTAAVESFLNESFEIEMFAATRCTLNDVKTISIQTANKERLQAIRHNIKMRHFKQNGIPEINLN